MVTAMSRASCTGVMKHAGQFSELQLASDTSWLCVASPFSRKQPLPAVSPTV